MLVYLLQRGRRHQNNVMIEIRRLLWKADICSRRAELSQWPHHVLGLISEDADWAKPQAQASFPESSGTSARCASAAHHPQSNSHSEFFSPMKKKNETIQSENKRKHGHFPQFCLVEKRIFLLRWKRKNGWVWTLNLKSPTLMYLSGYNSSVASPRST